MKPVLPVLFATALAACSFFGGSNEGGDGDGDGDGDVDAAVDSMSGLGPWGQPTRLLSLEAMGPLLNYDDPSITDSGLLYLAIDGDIYEAQRMADGITFSEPTLVSELSDLGLSESTIWIEPDGLRIMFGRASDLFEATRSAADQPWDPPVEVSELNTVAGEAMGQLTNGGLTLYFVSNRAGSFDIYRTTRPSLSDPFVTPPERLPVSDDTLTQSSVKLTADELTMYWAEKPKAAGTADFEMMFSERADTSTDFGAGSRILELNTPGAADSDFTPSADNRSAFFSSDRDDFLQPERIFYVER